MRIRIIGTVAVATLALAACGGGDGGGSAQDEVVDLMYEALEQEGISADVLDRDCMTDLVSELSDDDAEKLIEAGVDGDPDVSAEAEAIGDSMIECLDMAALMEEGG